MTLYLTLKWLHVVSSVLLVGTGFGSAYFMFFTNRSQDRHAQSIVSRLVVRADWWFTTPAVLVQPLTGVWMAQLAGWPLSTPWLLVSIGLYLLAGACWLPVVWLQLRMARLAAEAVLHDEALPPVYVRLACAWEALGYPAFAAMVGVFYLMVNKPTLW